MSEPIGPEVMTALEKPATSAETSTRRSIQKEARESSLSDPLADSLSDPLDVQFDGGGSGSGGNGGGSPPSEPSSGGSGAPDVPGASDPGPSPQGSSGTLFAKLSGPSTPGSGAAAAVERARSSRGAPLPATIQAKFEKSLGADLSDVRVHTGADSVQAAKGINARAYTEGKDIHFSGGEFDPSSAQGEKLLAHEVAHTVQQSSRGGATSVQGSLKVSQGGDPAEVQADHAAEAMVQEKEAAVSGAMAGDAVQRSVDASDFEGEEWSSGEEVLQADAQQLASKVNTVIGLGNSILKAGGLDLGEVKSKLKTHAEQQIQEFENDISAREGEIAWLESEIEYLEDLSYRDDYQEKKLAEYSLRLNGDKASNIPSLQDQLDAIEEAFDDGDPIEEKALDAAAKIAGYGKAMAEIGELIADGADDVDASMFSSLSDGLGKMERVFKLGSFVIEYADQDALSAFQANPNKETARAWARKVGSVFDKASGLVSGLPPGFDSITAGALQVPKVVIEGFITLLDERDKAIEEVMNAGRSSCGAQNLGEGQSSCKMT